MQLPLQRLGSGQAKRRQGGLRHLEVKDYQPLVKVVNAWFGGRHVSYLLQRSFFEHFRPTSFAIEKEGEILGFLIGYRSQTITNKAYIHFVAINPDYQGQGIGRRLYQHFFEGAIKLGCTEVSAITSPVNKKSIAFHTHMGFEILPGDAEVDAIPNFV